ncbi:hypothetical protein FQZ97_1133830 [compost metagenome]
MLGPKLWGCVERLAMGRLLVLVVGRESVLFAGGLAVSPTVSYVSMLLSWAQLLHRAPAESRKYCRASVVCCMADV